MKTEIYILRDGISHTPKEQKQITELTSYILDRKITHTIESKSFLTKNFRVHLTKKHINKEYEDIEKRFPLVPFTGGRSASEGRLKFWTNERVTSVILDFLNAGETSDKKWELIIKQGGELTNEY